MRSNFIKSTIILVIGGSISKILGMVIKIALTRNIGENGIGLYMLILPTFNLFITLCTMGMPISISKLVSERKINSKRLILSLIPISLLFNLFLIIMLFIISPYISNYLLSNKDTYYPLMAIGLTLPFICISSIIKGYFFGKERMFPHSLATIIEQIVRLLLIMYMIPKLMIYKINIVITFVVLINILSEFSSIICLLFFLPKGNKITINDFKYNKQNLKDTLDISIPTTGSRLIGSFTYFLEPIILTYILLKVGYNNSYITLEYGIINGMIRKKIKQAILLSLSIGIPITLIFIIIPDIPLKFIYNTSSGINYIRYLAPIFLLYYIQAPLTATMQGMGFAKRAMYGTFVGSIIRILVLGIVSYFRVGMLGLLLSTIINMIYVTLHHLCYINKYLKTVTYFE